ncbi:Hemocyte protein-glutamine gamma-glutamyltransferase-like 3, partial [Homarus americanus]
MALFDRIDNFLEGLVDRFRRDNEDIRREARETEVAYELANAGDTVDVGETLKAVSVDFQPKFNAANHHCEKFELVEVNKPSLVIRRGGSFSLIATFNKEPDLKKKHLCKLFFSFGPKPNPTKGTQAVLQVSGKKMFDKSYEQWDVRVVSQEGAKVTLEVQVPTDALVGLWRSAVQVKHRDTETGHLLRLDTDIYILFNAWNKHDTVYMEEEDKRQEYVLNDIGKVWVGTYPSAYGRHWVFGQFDDVVLPACILMMERSGLIDEARGDPIRVSRALSKIVNSNDDNGVVIGKWNGEYDAGTSPSAWTGSIKILEEYIHKGRSVRYGQCWVFAGVLNTVCRALGLPSRVVTNLNSAHDTNVSFTIDEYFNKEGDELTYTYGGTNPSGLDDSIWNFHVWNDVWMSRPDLPPGYGGWQAVDATPQEKSEGIFQCGPASHEALRLGQTSYNYDVAFVLAEVNADIVRWKEDESAVDGFKKLYSNKTQSRNARHAFRFPSEAIEDVEFSLEDVERVPLGDDFSVTLKAVNVSEAVRTVTVVLTASSMYYTGAKAQDIARAEGKFALKVKESKTLSLPVTYKQYYHKLVEHAMIKLVAHCTVDETSYAWVDDDRFEVLKPAIKVEVLSGGVVGMAMLTRFSFTNPLPISLTNSSLVIDGPSITKPKTIPIRRVLLYRAHEVLLCSCSDVRPKEEMVYELKLYPKKPADCTLVATFSSTELLNLSGSTNVSIAPAGN